MQITATNSPRECEPKKSPHLVPANILKLLDERPIALLAETKTVTPQVLRQLFPTGPIYVCDLYIEGIEKGRELPYGYEMDGIVNIDHHAPTALMSRRVSSGNLALEFLRHHGPLPADAQLVIHHLDCDSFVSSALMKGILPALPEWGDIVLAADHTGERNEYADLLQALSDLRDMRFSAENLMRLTQGAALCPKAQALVDLRDERRGELTAHIERGALRKDGGVAWLSSQGDMESELALSLIPEAVVLMVAIGPDDKGRWINRIRLGSAAPAGLTLPSLEIETFDPNWGGRWNAGSNKRGGGSMLHPTQYALRLAELLEGALLKL